MVDAGNVPLTIESAKNDGGGGWIGATIPGSHTTVKTALTTEPLYIVRNGGLPAASTLAGPGSNLNFWSKTTGNNQNHAFNMGFDSTGLYPSNSNSRLLAFPLRCLHQS